MPPQSHRQITLLLVLAVLGAALILYRLGSSGARARRRASRPETGRLPDVGGEGDDYIWAGNLGERVWRRRVVAVGDLHGDLNNAEKVLRMSGIIDTSSRWSAGETHFVQTGDIVDRGTDTIALYRLFQRLRSEARSAGGEVYSLLGNHEIMNAIGDWRYVTADDIATFEGGGQGRRNTLSVDGWLGKEWLANYSVVAKVPLSPYTSTSTSNHNPFLSFSHGSLNPLLSILTPFPSLPNELAHSLLFKSLTPPLHQPYPPAPYKGLPEGCTDQERELYGGEGVVWWRGLALEGEEKVCEWSEMLQKRLGVRRIIGGHTPNFEEIVSRCNASIIIIDTGISKAYGGVLSALEIEYSLHEVTQKGREEMFVDVGEGEGRKQQHLIAARSTDASKDGEDDQQPEADNGAEDDGLVGATFARGKTFDEVEVVRAIYETGKIVLDRRKTRVTFG